MPLTPQQKYELAILRALDLVYPRQLKNDVLKGDLQMAVEHFTVTEFASAIRRLEDLGQIRVWGNEDVIRYVITDTGRERLANLN